MTYVYQIVGTLVSVMGLFMYFYYFIGIALYDHSYISTNLHRDMAFRVLASTVLTIQHILLICYFLRFRKVKHGMCICGIVFVVISEAGWCTLCSDYSMPTHMIGFGVFVAGLFVYWMVIFVFDRVQFILDDQRFVYFLSAFIFCFIYCVFYAVYNEYSWFYEHLGMIFLSCASIYFFIHHDPNPKLVFYVEIEYESVLNEVF